MPELEPMFGAKPKNKTNWGKWQAKKGSNTQRGYGYKWEKIKKRIKERDNYLCQPCLKRGKYTPMHAVDHILPKSQGGTDDESNLQCICKPCHNRKTAIERANQ